MTDRPDPPVYPSMPEEMTLREFSHILVALGYFAVEAAEQGGTGDAVQMLDLQHRLMLANPETAILTDHVYGDSMHVANDDYEDIEAYLRDHDVLDNIDPDEVRGRVDMDDGDDDDDFTSIDIE